MRYKALFLLIPTLLLSCCGKSPEPEDKSISKILKTESGKTYYSLDNKPITPIGVQIRTDVLLNWEKQDFSAVEERFQKAKDLGVSLIEIPVHWSACEPTKDAYTFRDLGKMLTKADELGLKVEVLTFGTNTTGWSGQVPDYIKADSDTYPRYQSSVSPNDYFMVQNNKNLLEREGKWIGSLMEAIKAWSDTHDNKHVVSAIQIHNESDTFPRFVLDQQKIMTVDGSRRLTDIEAWKETYEAYDYLGGIVKQSAYPCITRVNVAQAYKDAWQSFVPEIFKLKNIDIVGDDTYEKTVAFNKLVIEDFNSQEYFEGNNFPHVSENDGSYETTPSLILASTAMGGGYMIYDLATPVYGIEQMGWDDWGILDSKTLEDKSHTELTRNIIKGISKAGSDYVLADKENIAAFNVTTNMPKESITQNIQTTHVLINFETATGALGYAVSSNDHIDVYVTSDSKLVFSNVTLGSASIGYVDDSGVFTKNKDVSLSGNTLEAKGENLYRIEITKVDSILKSNTVRNIG